VPPCRLRPHQQVLFRQRPAAPWLQLPNYSSKPTLLRYGNGGTEKRATVAFTTQRGLTQVLGLMTNFSGFSVHFWLLCGLYTGLGGAIFLRLKLRKHVADGQLDRASLQRFTRGWCIAVLAPCLVFWLLGLSAGPSASPDYLSWAAPQKWIALGLNVACWLALLAWVWVGPGATELSRYLAPAFSASTLARPIAIRALAVVIVAAGVLALALQSGPTTQ
jgi:hypothetical protein